jgi:3-oxoacyl-[acyl-carrier-protein] synthase-3
VHHHLGLPERCIVYDVSNACLGLVNGMVQIANMIELGQIRAGLVVGTESGRQLVETTIAALNRDTSLTRSQLKRALASLTIGSGSCAVLLTHRDISQTGNRIHTATVRAHTRHHDLCRSGRDEAAPDMRPLMDTDSERLMMEGIATGAHTFDDFLIESGWSRDQINATFCHQVGTIQRKLMLAEVDLDVNRDFATVEWLGNTGSCAMPLALAIGMQRGFAGPGENLALLGIGSGINCIMMAIEWQRTLVRNTLEEPLEEADAAEIDAADADAAPQASAS